MGPVRRSLATLAVAVAVLASCSFGDGSDAPPEDPAETADDGGSPDPAPESELESDPGDTDEPAPEPSCRRDELTVGQLELTGPDAVEVATRVAAQTHRCAPLVVVAADDPWTASLAAAVAVATDAPLLLADPAAPEELAPTLSGLAVDELVTVGFELAAFDLPGTELLAPADDRLGLAVLVAGHVGTEEFLAVPSDDTEALAAALARLAPGLALLPLPDDPEQFAARLPPSARLQVMTDAGDADTRVDRLLEVGIDAEAAPDLDELWTPAIDAVASEGVTWLADPTDGATAAVAAVAAAGRGEALLPVDGDDLRSGRDRTERLRSAEPGTLAVVGAVTEAADWQLATVLEGQPLPWGGFRLFEDERMVAIYGSVETTVLGVLGEQDLDGSVDRARTVAAPYDADGLGVRPTFELITTIASSTEQPTGDYSRRTPIELLRPWVDRAAEEGIYVFLDLQPGRTDFLTQAIEY